MLKIELSLKDRKNIIETIDKIESNNKIRKLISDQFKEENFN